LIVLIGIGVVLIFSVSTGFVASLLQKPPSFAVQAKVTMLYPDKSVISLEHMAGDPVHIVGNFSSGVFFILTAPDGEKIAVSPSPVMNGNSWVRGGIITIYFDGSHFWATDDISTVIARNGQGSLTGMPHGVWIIYITDQATKVVVNSLAVTV
jgi:hypothetical protein